MMNRQALLLRRAVLYSELSFSRIGSYKSKILAPGMTTYTGVYVMGPGSDLMISLSKSQNWVARESAAKMQYVRMCDEMFNRVTG